MVPAGEPKVPPQLPFGGDVSPYFRCEAAWFLIRAARLQMEATDAARPPRRTASLEALPVQQPFTRVSFTARPSENVTIHSLFPSIMEFPAANSVPAQVCT
jgi:hypothetical protein